MAFDLGITIIIHKKDDIEFVTEFPFLLGHPIYVFEWLATFRNVFNKFLINVIDSRLNLDLV